MEIRLDGGSTVSFDPAGDGEALSVQLRKWFDPLASLSLL